MNAEQEQICQLADLVERKGPMRIGDRVVSDQEKRQIVEGLRYLVAHRCVDEMNAAKKRSVG